MERPRRVYVVVAAAVAALVVACTPRERAAPGDATPASPPADAAAPATASVTAPAPAPDACRSDDECAVLLVEPSGERMCCASCTTTPVTKLRAAAVHEACFGKTPATCPALACPMGPTRAVCKDGRCAATRDAADGGPTLVVDAERRLPASACNAWLGCAKVLGSAQNGWLLTGHERTELVGKTVTVAPVCFHDKGTRRCVDAAILPLACVATPPEAQTPPPVCPKR